jgi:predicted alpha-1,2-mannosidase
MPVKNYFKQPSVVLCCVLTLASPLQASNLDKVNPFIGTDGKNVTEYGGMMPFVVPPFGMTSWTPQTRQNKISRTSYRYSDKMISGFIGTHQSAIWMGDFGYVTVMPELDWIKTTPEARQLPFSHANETATPYYYSVEMDAGAERTIRTEVTATERCALMQITYPECKNSSLVVEATRTGVVGFSAVDPVTHEISGYNPDRMDAHLTNLKLPNFKGYFVVKISKPFQSCGTYLADEIKEGRLTAMGKNAGSFASFATTQNEVVTVRIGTSFISIDQARANLAIELGDLDFETAKNRLKKVWADKLSLVTIEGGTHDQLVQFYTGMYHCMQYPRLFSEHGNYYSAFDDKIHAGVSYTGYSMWDIFRAGFSFLTLFCPEHVDGMVQALLQNYQEGGWMPKWPNPSYTNIMLGTHADSLVAEAINKGFHGFDYQLAWQAVYKTAMTPPNGDERHRWQDREMAEPYSAREGLTSYKQLGYVANDRTARAASATLEGAYNDWCVAQVAKAAGHEQDYRHFLERSRNYRNLYNPKTEEVQARNADGSWASPKDGWTEGGRSQNIFAVWHDIPGLIELMGGREKFRSKLDTNPADMSNEPGQHWPYLYDYCGQPHETQKLVRKGLMQGYANTPDGLPGNDDCGQISAWWLFTAMGFYPVNPASGEYMIGSPLFPRVSFKLQNGKTFIIEASKNSDANFYIQSATLNGKVLNEPKISWAQIQAGGILHFEMGNTPSKWGADWSGKKIE